MRKVLEQVALRLQAFIAQRDDLALVVGCSGAESPLLFKILEALSEASSSELSWVFGETFAGPREYATAVVESFAAKHEAARLLQDKEGLEVWPAIPEALRELRLPPAQRLRGLMTFARSLLPAPEGLLVAWVMFPLAIADHDGYLGLMREVLRHEFPFPWCHHMRIILRDDASHPVLASALDGSPRLAFYRPDLSQKSMEQALEQEIDDQRLPLEQRLQAVLITAGIDYAHKRHDQALQKYRLIFKFFAGKGELALAALALNGMGEVHLARGDKAEAAECFLAALIPSSEGQSPPLPVLTNVVLNLARLRASEENWADAEAYYDELQKLATVQRNPPLKVFAIENLGLARHEQGKVPEGLECWQIGATVAEKLELPEARKSMLERLRSHYRRTRDRAKAREVEEQLAATTSTPTLADR
jgi:tetratricopeptide (TPR) repeat protein